MANNSYSGKFDLKNAEALKGKLQAAGFEFKTVDHSLWRAQNAEVAVTLYKSGKLLVQGKGTDTFVEIYLGLKQSTSSQQTLPLPKQAASAELVQPKHSSWIGTDESGKGDYFGPLVVAGVLIDASNIKILQELGIKDSKKMTDPVIEKAAIKIKECSTFSVVTIMPAKYNELYGKFKNLNSLLAWGHARAIENILEKKKCEYAISDKFGNESLILNALMAKGRSIKLEQRVRAEDDLAVAAASVLARNEFVQRMKRMSLEYRINFQKGASEKVKQQAGELASRDGKEVLKNVAKLHFKTTNELQIKSSV